MDKYKNNIEKFIKENDHMLKELFYDYTVVGEFYNKYGNWIKFFRKDIMDEVENSIKIYTGSQAEWMCKDDVILYFDTAKIAVQKEKIEERIKGEE